MSFGYARTLQTLRQEVARWKGRGETVALVPTMGALHAGHMSLVELGKQKAARVVTSVFVNPTQFAPNEDFASYPRNEQKDADMLEAAGCDLMYLPTAEIMYPAGFSTTITVSGVTAPMEGAMRPTHFAGVATVVAKLLLQVQPDFAIFGQKDFQQLAVIKRMVADLDIPVEIIGAAIKRDHDGLALSSRNAYLNEQERAIAGKLNVLMGDAAESIRNGRPIAEIIRQTKEGLIEYGFDSVDYVEVVNPSTLDSITDEKLDGPGRILIAARLGKTRLIDNMAI